MSVQTGCEATWSRYFPTTLKGLALSWFSGLTPGIITNFSVLEALFHQHFIAGRRHKKTSIHLMLIKQQEHESLADYIKRFNEESLKISDLQDGVAFTALMSRLWPGKFRWSLAENEVTTFTEAMIRAQKFIQASDICKPVGEKCKKKKEELPYWESNKNMRSNQQLLPRVVDNGNDPHFYRKRREIYLDLKHKLVLPIPPPIRTSKDRRDQRLWCEYHRECGHTMKDCRELKKALDHLDDQGKLNRYIKHPREEKGKEKETRNDSDNTDGYVGVIVGGHASGGSSGRARKAHLQSMTQRAHQNKIKASISVYQLLLQYETDDGQVAKIYGDQQTARACYTNIF
ncbi:uncharacterized protein LOC125498575 [Beta vulgaris subsp. vulgaris]|uniref:uncharacterized protein LOC125498575 n=1 Tax=Beta vulgaris subsp. vulgaris TaxID=3555 RepID=UPI0020368DC0|nr:uncharacterized protein LOC125498575 [Beta vulgaris subsp. vulgaris]